MRRILCCLVLSALTLICVDPAFSAKKVSLQRISDSIKNKDADMFLTSVNMLQVIHAKHVLAYVKDNKASLNPGMADDINKLLAAVSDGSIADECAKSADSLCPWVPELLEKAVLTEVSGSSAVAHLKNGRHQSWLVLRKFIDGWKVTAVAASKKQAEACAAPGFIRSRAGYLEELSRKNAMAGIIGQNALTRKEQDALNGILTDVRFFEVEQERGKSFLSIEGVISNNNNSLTGMCGLELAITDKQGNVLDAQHYLLDGPIISAGRDASFLVKRRLDTPEQEELAKGLQSGQYKATGRVSCIVHQNKVLLR